MGLKERIIKKKMESQENLERIRGWIDYVIVPKGFLEADELLWCVLNVRDPLTNKKFKAVGTTNHHSVGDYLEFIGEWKKGKNGKDEFHFTYAIRADDDIVGATSMLAFLFGPKRAERLIDYYDSNPLNAINTFKQNIEEFRVDMKDVSGIGQKTIDKALEKQKKYQAIDSLYYKFVRFGVSLNSALKLLKLWGTNASSIIDDNPYQLINVDGFSFETVDGIGLRYYNYSKEDLRRIEAYIIALLKAKLYTGDCYMLLEELIVQAERGLNVDESLIREAIIKMLDSRKIYKRLKKTDIVIYLPYIYKAENNVAQMVATAVRKNRIVAESKVDEMIAQYEAMKGFQLADKQREGIKRSSINQFSIISGPPGSGKTTLIDCICYIFQNSKKHVDIELCALAGKAATRMSEATGMEASTIHRLLGYNPETGWRFNEHNPLQVDLLIVDEFSMVDIVLFERLMKAISSDTVVILTGDKDQLPSVDPGQVLEDLIDVDYIPKTILEKIYRAVDGSTTLPRALDFNFQERVPDLTDAQDFAFIETPESDIQATKDEVLQLYLKKVTQWGIENVCLLEPQNKGDIGCDVMNVEIQAILNPYDEDKPEMKVGFKKIIRVGDRVLQLKNHPEFNLFNGMVGNVIDCIYSDTKNSNEDRIVVDYDGMEHTYLREDFDELRLAYAMTIHKTQGSEYKCSIMLMDGLHRFMIKKRLVYTGMTRNKNELFIVGQKNMMQYALDNKERKRNTMLTELLKQYDI